MQETFSILVIDDLEINCRLLKIILETEGFTVYVAYDGPSGRKIAIEKKPTLIILDLSMPGESGFETLSRLKSNLETADIPVVIISALSGAQQKVLGLESGAVDFITKPFENSEVVARVRLHIRLARSQRAYFEQQIRQLEKLKDAQQSMLIKPQDFPEARFGVYYQPVYQAGGDFYDVLSLGKNNTGYICADVSGHDSGSSLATSALKALIQQNTGPVFKMEDSIKIINTILYRILPEDIFLTLLFLVINRATGKMKVLNAGHVPLIYKPRNGKAEIITTQGDILGMFEKVRHSILEVNVSEGGQVYMLTDGLVCLDKSMGLLESLTKLCAIIDKLEYIDMDTSIKNIIHEMTWGSALPDDDILLLGFDIE
ncbi:MAG: fused response regulator/phosphatase [Spirochaetales bacterium]|nr:fused response regulator/phosphatase [Spirochaetales bacterium]